MDMSSFFKKNTIMGFVSCSLIIIFLALSAYDYDLLLNVVNEFSNLSLCEEQKDSFTSNVEGVTSPNVNVEEVTLPNVNVEGVTSPTVAVLISCILNNAFTFRELLIFKKKLEIEKVNFATQIIANAVDHPNLILDNHSPLVDMTDLFDIDKLLGAVNAVILSKILVTLIIILFVLFLIYLIRKNFSEISTSEKSFYYIFPIVILLFAIFFLLCFLT